VTNQDIAASIIGFIRQKALGSALLPYEERVDRALKKILTMQAWKEPQRKWLERIAKQLKKEVIVDRQALDQGEFGAQGGFQLINKRLDGELELVLARFQDAIWDDVA
jgi:type I restriction enzyme R subunit